MLLHTVHLMMQVQIEEFQVKVQTSEEGHKKLEEECKVLNEKMSDLESNHQKTQFELSSQLEELKMKVPLYYYT